MKGRVVLVTGASSGIGFETARGLAGMGARVVLAVRDVARGEAACAEILREHPDAALEVARVDLASLADVRRFASDLRASHERLHVLVLNAGLHTARRELTVDGYERTFAVNHLAHFLLAHELLDLLKRSAPSRVLVVASDAHLGGRLDLDDLMGERRWSGLRAYARSKLANVMFAYELAERLAGTGVTVNAIHPGSVRTGWARGRESGLFGLGVALASPFLLSPEAGARTSVWAASDPALERVTGRYLKRRRIAGSSSASHDREARRKLWEVSERLVGLHAESR